MLIYNGKYDFRSFIIYYFAALTSSYSLQEN